MATILLFGLPDVGTEALLHLTVSHPRANGPQFMVHHLLDAVPPRKRITPEKLPLIVRSVTDKFERLLHAAANTNEKHILITSPIILPTQLGYSPLFPTKIFTGHKIDLIVLTEAKTTFIRTPSVTMLPKGFISFKQLEQLEELQHIQRSLAAHIAAQCGAPLAVVTIDRNNMKPSVHTLLDLLDLVAKPFKPSRGG
ncbi:MAG: hypothetical protein KKA90_03815 [Nanoarchaeota archaeon]|nr:hypothetical protein [Nanoarchaeota archaeon]